MGLKWLLTVISIIISEILLTGTTFGMSCEDSLLGYSAEEQSRVIRTTTERTQRRIGRRLAVVKSAFAPIRDDAEARAVSLNLNSLLRKIDRIEVQPFEEGQYSYQGRLLQHFYDLYHDYLNAIGVAHVYIHFGQTRPLYVILPRGSHPLNEEARHLMDGHGTILAVSTSLKSQFVAKENIIYLPFRTFRGDLGQRESEIIKALESQRVSEIEISSTGSKEEFNFLVDSNNAIPGSLRFLSYYMQDGFYSYRQSFRTGFIKELRPDIQDSLTNLVKTSKPLTDMEAVASLAIRRGPEWVASFPNIFKLGRTAAPFQPGFQEVKALIRKVYSESERDSDLFLILGGTGHFTPSNILQLQQFASVKGNNIRSVSFVIVTDSKAWGPIYYIHTLAKPGSNVLDSTIYADQLREAFNIYDLPKRRELNPFDPK